MSHKIAVIGLGYVGLPLAVALSRNYEVVGYDINEARVSEIDTNYDRTNELSEADLASSNLQVSHLETVLENNDIFIVTVPTPIDHKARPDLSLIEIASQTVGRYIKKNSIVVFESTVYPGVTEDICAKILEETSGLKSGVDFHLGYSPERINPGDKIHTLNKITKVISGQNAATIATLKAVYGSINNNNIFVAKNIKAAEAAKVIENTQRDINIAFINEITRIVNKLDLSIYDVLDAAKTKWNFLGFEPGLVGGHCIGVDPYYIAHLAKELKINPQTILAGRDGNESMPHYLASRVIERLSENNIDRPRVLILGLTFKENIPDLRNTKVIELINNFRSQSFEIDVHDSHADNEDAFKFFDIRLLADESILDKSVKYDCIILAVPHSQYRELTEHALLSKLNRNGFVVDIKNVLQDIPDSKRLIF